jgi:hypothetical protein
VVEHPERALARVARKVGVDGICSPVVIPKAFDDKYYAHIVGAGSDLGKRFEGRGMRVLQTVLANLPQLGGENRAMEIASIVSRTANEWIYLVFVGIVEPRRELKDVDELKGAMQLIRALERNGIKVLVGFCSSDLLLWKAAGASACASGKFFNLRRFTRQRFEEPNATGGGQLPYWFEEGLLAFLRQGDLIHVRKHNLLSETSLRNPFAKEILSALDEATSARRKPRPWLGTSWRQFLYWFADVEGRISRKEITAEELITTADANWSKLDAAKVLLEERFNDGTWVRYWLNTLHEFQVQ